MKWVQILCVHVHVLRGHVKKVLIVELDHGYAVCGLKNLRMLYWIMDADDTLYVVCELYGRTYARTHRQNPQLNTLVWGSLTPTQLVVHVVADH